MTSSKQFLVTWDIDWTLIRCDRSHVFHPRALEAACTEFFAPCDSLEATLGGPVSGWMDRSIFTSLIQKLGFEPTIDNITKAERRAEEIYIQTCNETPPSLPGIIDTLEALSKVPNVTLAVASGNLPGIAWRKLHLAGLDGYFPERFAGLGTLADRKDAILTAKSQAETAKGITFDAIIHIGDTPADAKAAIEAGVTAFCVRTGAYPLSQYPQPSYIFDSIIEGHDQLWKLLELD